MFLFALKPRSIAAWTCDSIRANLNISISAEYRKASSKKLKNSSKPTSSTWKYWNELRFFLKKMVWRKLAYPLFAASAFASVNGFEETSFSKTWSNSFLHESGYSTINIIGLMLRQQRANWDWTGVLVNRWLLFYFK